MTHDTMTTLHQEQANHHTYTMTHEQWKELKVGDTLRRYSGHHRKVAHIIEGLPHRDTRTLVLTTLDGSEMQSEMRPSVWELVPTPPEQQHEPITCEQWNQLDVYDRVIHRQTGEVYEVSLVSTDYGRKPRRSPRKLLLQSLHTDRQTFSGVPSDWTLPPQKNLQDVQTDHPCGEKPSAALSSRTRSGADAGAVTSPQHEWAAGDCEDAANEIRHAEAPTGDGLSLRWLAVMLLFALWSGICTVYQTGQSIAWLWSLATGGAR